MSVVSLASFVDVGYPEVDYSVADEYMLPPPQYAAQAAAGSKRRGGPTGTRSTSAGRSC